jgi:hypothetical protein
MELRLKRKVLFLALAVFMIFSFFFAEILIADDLDHDCIGEGCPFCLVIEIANNFLKSLKLTAVAAFLTVCLIFLIQTFIKIIDFPISLYSPVTLKVRFNS